MWIDFLLKLIEQLLSSLRKPNGEKAEESDWEDFREWARKYELTRIFSPSSAKILGTNTESTAVGLSIVAGNGAEGLESIQPPIAQSSATEANWTTSSVCGFLAFTQMSPPIVPNIPLIDLSPAAARIANTEKIPTILTFDEAVTEVIGAVWSGHKVNPIWTAALTEHIGSDGLARSEYVTTYRAKTDWQTNNITTTPKYGGYTAGLARKAVRDRGIGKLFQAERIMK